MHQQRAYVVIPFERVGSAVGPRQALIVDQPVKARLLAQSLAERVPGVAVLERQIDPETGDSVDTIVAEFGAVPPNLPHLANWTMMLH